MTADPVRVRFAPSPTGMLHVGGARTALFNWLFARHCGGTFILRIEDTDRARYDARALDDISASLRWLGLQWDEGYEIGGPCGPYVQSERTAIYLQHAQQLLDSGHAYKCYCTPDRLAAAREQQQRDGSAPGYDRACRDLSPDARAAHNAAGAPFVIRFRMPLTGATTFVDAIRGAISYPNAQQDDFVLLKSDGFPTYHLANIVDDHLMRISHVLRGDEWIPSTPKHVQLYAAFGWQPPVFAHLPVILAPGGGKLSKRHGAAAVCEYRALGYLPDALVNFLALLGWAVAADNEIVPRAQMLKEFTLEGINKTGAQFDHEKLNWMNGAYIRQLPLAEFMREVTPFLTNAGVLKGAEDPAQVAQVLQMEQARVHLLSDAPAACAFFFADTLEYDRQAVKKVLQREGVRDHLLAVCDLLAGVPPGQFDAAHLEARLQEYLTRSGRPLKNVVHPLRVAVTGRSASPGIFETLVAIGQARVVQRLTHAAGQLCSAP
ncbi:MAG: glutamate--tRNA ligase [bacterium]|nr:glutamate--tRNA ligase [bacterium]